MEYFVGVDVGTGSVRAALVDSQGHILSTNVENITTWNPEPNFYEQSSAEIWAACIAVIKNVVNHKNVDKNQIKGLGFAATCSLVVLNDNFENLTVSKSGDDKRNIILWMDHRASKEADVVNSTQHPVLKQVGGKISLEMEIPKLIWLKQNLPETWVRSGHFMDLADFLTYKATGESTRSLCTLVCKWCYQSFDNRKGDGDQKSGWPTDFFEQIGLQDICQKGNCRKIGDHVIPPKTFCGFLKPDLLELLGLSQSQKVAVSSGLIDAHAGAVGLLSTRNERVTQDCTKKLSLICGTSTCHMIVQDDLKFTPGVWGPYHNAIFENMYLSEAGQSATGKLLEFVVQNHKAYEDVLNLVNRNENKVFEFLNRKLDRMASDRGLDNVCYLTKHFHVWPDFHGNRSPIADADLKGMICGLTMNSDIDALAILYLATLQSLCYGTRHIVEKLEQSNIGLIETLLICGGLSNNSLFVQTQADVCYLPVLVPDEKESVLLGSAICGATAYRQYKNGVKSSNRDLFENMGSSGKLVEPIFGDVAKYHRRKYKVFIKMLEDQYKYKTLMDV